MARFRKAISASTADTFAWAFSASAFAGRASASVAGACAARKRRLQCNVGPAGHRRDRITSTDSPLRQSRPARRFSDQPARDGRQLRTGFRQSIPSLEGIGGCGRCRQRQDSVGVRDHRLRDRETAESGRRALAGTDHPETHGLGGALRRRPGADRGRSPSPGGQGGGRAELHHHREPADLPQLPRAAAQLQGMRRPAARRRGRPRRRPGPERYPGRGRKRPARGSHPGGPSRASSGS